MVVLTQKREHHHWLLFAKDVFIIPVYLSVLMTLFGSILIMVALHVFGVAEIDILSRLKLRCGVLDSSIEENKKEKSNVEHKESINVEICNVDNDDDSREKEPESDEVCVESGKYEKKWCAVIFAAANVLIFALMFVLNHYVFSAEKAAHEYCNFFKLYILLVIVISAALIDLKKKIIPNILILTGLALRFIIYIFELILCRDMLMDIFLNDLTGIAIGFGVLFLAGLLTKGAVGFGDAKLFAVIGFTTGTYCTLSTLFFGLFGSAIASIVLLIKYHDKKKAFAFAPYILIGYLITLITGSF